MERAWTADRRVGFIYMENILPDKLKIGQLFSMGKMTFLIIAHGFGNYGLRIAYYDIRNCSARWCDADILLKYVTQYH